jgi:diguanylate cyclase (GGDEF)-like protein
MNPTKLAASRNRRALAGASVALLALIAVITVGALVTRGSAATSATGVRMANAYQNAASAVAAEESLERKYRLQPDPTVLAGHTAAEESLQRAMGQVAGLGDGADRRLAVVVLNEDRAYASASARLFASVDRHDPVAVTNAIDTTSVDPVFGVMETQIYQEAAQNETEALAATARVHQVGDLALVLDVACLAAGIGLVVAAAIIVARYQGALRAESDHNRHQALHDSLTQLPNRALFQERTAAALSAAELSGASVAVMLLDLNRFKEVNDTLGHQYGDDLLVQVAARLTGTLQADDSVARLGGDEFAVLLPASTWDDTVAAAEHIGATLHAPFVVQGVALDVDASIGIAIAEPDDDVDDVLRHADVAMYGAKADHHLFARYEASRDINSLSRLVLLGDLRRAISGGQLVLHYQPKIDAATEVLGSAEALVRWQHPTRGLLQPDQFIPIAETTALIHPLTTEVLRLALIQARRWVKAARPVPVAVNISARSLLDATFPGQVQTLLDTYGVDPRLLILELTETSIMTDRELAVAVLQELDAMGVSLSIDDFGTGYSSLAYLKSLPVQELKIDRSFVAGVCDDPDSAVIVRSAIELGHNLGLRVVAEGVEDGATQLALTDMGCDLLQGYHVCRPVPAADFDRWVDARRLRSRSGRPRRPVLLRGM